MVSRASVRALLVPDFDFDFELDGYRVAELECTEETGVRGNAEVGLLDGGASPVPAGAGAGDLEPGGPGYAVQGEGAFDRTAAGRAGGHEDSGRLEPGARRGAEDLAGLGLDVAAVPVGERLGAAGALADREGAEVEFGGEGHRLAGVAVGWHGDPCRPPGDLQRQVVARAGGQSFAAGFDEHPASAGAELMCSGDVRHGPTVRADLAQNPAQLNGVSPNSSRIRRRSRSRGSVAPPTQRLTVFTDTPSWRAAASIVMPSRRSTLAIQSANDDASPSAPLASLAPPTPSTPSAPARSGGMDPPELRKDVSALTLVGVPRLGPERSTSTST